MNNNIRNIILATFVGLSKKLLVRKNKNIVRHRRLIQQFQQFIRTQLGLNFQYEGAFPD